MFKKILVGLLATAIFGSIAYSGYSFGRYLASKDSAAPAQQTAQRAVQG